jgi:hypothetical protein
MRQGSVGLLEAPSPPAQVSGESENLRLRLVPGREARGATVSPVLEQMPKEISAFALGCVHEFLDVQISDNLIQTWDGERTSPKSD